MDVAIIIVNYNTKKLTLQCIESVVREGSPLKKEIIIVDNASTDGSVKEIIRSIKGVKSTKSIKGFLIQNKENVGFAKAVNQGIRKAKGKYILLLNSDTKVKKGAIGKVFEFAEKTKGAGVIGMQLLNPDGSVQSSCYNFPIVGKAIKQYWFGKKGLLDKFVPKGKKAVEVDAVVGAAFLITPQAIKRVGLLDEKFFMYYEDLDYCHRVWKSGLRVYYLPSAKVTHYHGASGGKSGSLVKSSKIYHGFVKHYLLNFIIWSGQKWQRFFEK